MEAKQYKNKEAVIFVMDTMRQALLYISAVPFTDMNKNMCVTMRAMARGALKQCADALGPKEEGAGGIPIKEGAIQ